MYNKSGKNGVKKMRGRPFDEFRCFFIKDFRKGDSIRVSDKSSERGFVRGVVTNVDFDNCLIHYKTASSKENVATINQIVSLEEFKKNFLDN